MKQLTILELMEILDNYEGGLTGFGDLLASSREHADLWHFLVIRKGKYTDSVEDRMDAYAYVFGKNAKYKAHKMLSLLKYLIDLLPLYIKQKNDEISSEGQRSWAKIYLENGHEEQAKVANENVLKNVLKEKGVERDYIPWLVKHEQHFGPHEVKDMNNLFQCDKELDEFYRKCKLKYFIEMMTDCRGRGVEINAELEKKIRDFVAALPEEKSPVVSVLVLAIACFFRPSFSLYETFKLGYFEKIKFLGAEQEYLLYSLINALAMIPKPDEKSRQEYLILYRFGIEKELLTIGGYIYSLQFENIIFTAEAMADYDLIELAVHKLAPFIKDKKDRKSHLLIASAYVFFGRKQFEEAMEVLEELEKMQNLPYYLILRKHLLKVKCAYEIAEDKQKAFIYLKSKESGFRKMLDRYVKSGEIDGLKKENLLNFFNILLSIANQSNPKCTVSALQLRIRQINGKTTDLKWLNEKIAGLSD